MASVSIQGARKVFGAVEIIRGVDVSIGDGEFVVLVGPSGCGKSTLLRMLAGLETISAGEIRIGARVVNQVPPKDRDIAMVFQNYALYPHMNVAENMAFSMKLRGMDKGEMARRVENAAKILNLTHLLDRFPKQLSGGSASAWPWAEPSCAIRRSSCSMSHSRISMRSCACRCAQRSRNCTSG